MLIPAITIPTSSCSREDWAQTWMSWGSLDATSSSDKASMAKSSHSWDFVSEIFNRIKKKVSLCSSSSCIHSSKENCCHLITESLSAKETTDCCFCGRCPWCWNDRTHSEVTVSQHQSSSMHIVIGGFIMVHLGSALKRSQTVFLL